MPNLGHELKLILKLRLVASGTLWIFFIFLVLWQWQWQEVSGQDSGQTGALASSYPFEQKYLQYRDYICPLTCNIGALRLTDDKKYPICLCYDTENKDNKGKEMMKDPGNYYKTNCTRYPLGSMMTNVCPDSSDKTAYQTGNLKDVTDKDSKQSIGHLDSNLKRTPTTNSNFSNFKLLSDEQRQSCLPTCLSLRYSQLFICDGEGMPNTCACNPFIFDVTSGRSTGGRNFGPVTYCACGYGYSGASPEPEPYPKPINPVPTSQYPPPPPLPSGILASNKMNLSLS